MIEGRDGKLYTSTATPKPSSPKPKRPQPDPWTPTPGGGYLYSDVVKLTHRISSIPVEAARFAPEEIDRIKVVLMDLGAVVEDRLHELGVEED